MGGYKNVAIFHRLIGSSEGFNEGAKTYIKANLPIKKQQYFYTYELKQHFKFQLLQRASLKN